MLGGGGAVVVVECRRGTVVAGATVTGGGVVITGVDAGGPSGGTDNAPTWRPNSVMKLGRVRVKGPGGKKLITGKFAVAAPMNVPQIFAG